MPRFDSVNADGCYHPSVAAERVIDLLAPGDEAAPALLSIDGLALSHGELRATISRLAGQLRAAGIQRGERVAIVLPNGPEMALTFLAVASCATAAPLNPAYREEEFRFYMDDLHAKSLITLPGDAAEAHAAASDGVLRLTVEGRGSETAFKLEGRTLAPAPLEFAEPDDIALVLHTSGTTARPKIVPLSQRNLATLGRQHPQLPGPHAHRPLSERDATVPHPWDHGGVAGLALGRRVR